MMAGLRRKAEELASRCHRLERWGRLVWDDAKHQAAGWSRLVLAWFRGHPTASIALAVLGVIVVLLGPVLWALGGWALIQETTTRALTAFASMSPEKKPERIVEAYGKLVGAVGLLAAAPIGLLGVGLAFWRTWNQHRDGVLAARKLEAESYAKAAEAFAKAVDHLGSDKSSVRMGAVLALEALGKATPRLLSQAIEILCAFVRENRPVPNAPPASNPSQSARFPTDIELIITIVSRLKQQDADNCIEVDLHYVDLSNANLSKHDLRNFALNKADLSKATLMWTNLVEASLMAANLSGALLLWADLSKADLREANLTNTKLVKTNLVAANLSGANLSGADLSGADLRHANLSGVNLSDANLSGAKLFRADLSGANLSDANLSDAGLFGVTLPGGRVWKSKDLPPPEVIAEVVAKVLLP